MYVVDLIGRLDTSLDWVRYGSVFRYYGKAIEDGIDPLPSAASSRSPSFSPPSVR